MQRQVSQCDDHMVLKSLTAAVKLTVKSAALAEGNWIGNSLSQRERDVQGLVAACVVH